MTSFGCGRAGVAPLPGRERRKPGRLVDGREADEPVDDPAESVRLTELEADDLGDEIELRDRYETPVEPSDNEEEPGGEIECLHAFSFPCPISVQGMYRVCSSLSNVCTIFVQWVQ